jgi:hypothetical protein
MTTSFLDRHVIGFFVCTGILTAVCAVVYDRLYIRWLWRSTLRRELRKEFTILYLTGGEQTPLPEED